MNGKNRNDTDRKLNTIILQNRVILSALIRLGFDVKRMEKEMALDFAEMEAAIAKNTEVDESASTLLDRLTAEIVRLANEITNPADQQKLKDLAASLAAKNDVLSAAVQKNTRGDPVPA